MFALKFFVIIVCVVTVADCFPHKAEAQDTTSYRPEEPAIPTTYGLRIGKRTFISSGAGIEFTYNDNLTLTKKNKKSDLIIAPALRLGIIHSYSKQSRIRSAFDISFVKHLNYDELDHFAFTPNGGNDFELSLRAFDNWIFRLSNTFSLSRSVVVRNVALGVDGVTTFNNVTRLSADADYNNVVLGGSYSCSMNFGLDQDFRYLDSLNHTVEAQVGFRISRPILVGIKSSVGYFDNLRNELNDGISFSAQGYGNFVLTRNITATASLGYQNAFFNDNKGLYRDDSDFRSYIFSFGLNQELSTRAYQSVSVSRGIQPAVRSNYQETTSLSYNLSYSYSRFLTLEFLFDWLTYEESSNPKDVPAQSDIYSITLGTGVALTRNASLVLRYHFRWSDSAGENNYRNNIFTVALNYNF